MKDRTESTIKAKNQSLPQGFSQLEKERGAGNEIAEEFGPSLTGEPSKLHFYLDWRTRHRLLSKLVIKSCSISFTYLST